MARPKKKGLDYFPVDTNILQNKKVRRLKRRAGHAAVVLYLQILCDCYANSYFVKWNDDYRLELSEQIEIQEDEIEKMVRLMVDLNLFDRAMFENNDVLTSVNIQNRYIAAKTQFLTNNEIDRTYLIVDFSSKPNVNGTLQRTKSAPGEGKSAQNKIEENRRKENNSTTTTNACARENLEPTDYSFNGKCARLRKDLLKDEEWLHSVSVFSGKGGKTVLERLPGAMELFETHLVSIGETGTILDVNDYKRRFQSWWRCLNFETKEGILARNQPVPRPQTKSLSRIDEMQRVCEEAKIMTRQMLKLR